MSQQEEDIRHCRTTKLIVAEEDCPSSSVTMADSRLFKPLKIGNIEVQHRVGMAPLTRMRATADRIPTPMMKEYYTQRASVPGTLILSEGTFVSLRCGGFPYAPGIWNQAQIDAWREITDAVHARGCFIYCQIFSMGRAADAATAAAEGQDIVGPSAIAMDGDAPVPRAMTIAEIEQTVQDFAAAARNAISAGFDGVECHSANGCLVDQFLQDVSNQRTDAYGGSIANRSRFLDEVLRAMVDAVGAERVGLRFSPWSTFHGMKMKDPVPQFSDAIKRAASYNLAYLSLVESRISGAEQVSDGVGNERLDFAYDLWHGPILVAGGYRAEEARRLVDVEHPDKDIVVLFGRFFISNADMVHRVKERLGLSAYDRSTFYVPQSAVGYVDYPYSQEYLATYATA
ncbi:NADH:flavin oxidoreductase/NADH oxidase family protein-like protein [Xylariaceae sp. FL1272]|nr:NADH:flavin oxidoreductase/NADH oxidase family protein-like protein [Xylariaceae sp. FL1272]